MHTNLQLVHFGLDVTYPLCTVHSKFTAVLLNLYWCADMSTNLCAFLSDRQAAYVAQPGTSNFRSSVIYKARMRIQYSFPLHNLSKHTTQPSINIWNVCLQAYWPSWDGSYSYWSSWAAATQTCGWSQWEPRSFNFESSRVWAPGWNYSSAKVITWWEPTYTP